MSAPAGTTAITVKTEGRDATYQVAVMLSAHLGKRLTLNTALIEAEKYIRATLAESASHAHAEPLNGG